MNRTMKILMLVAMLAGSAAAQSATAPEPQQSIAGLQQALNSRDFNALAALYADGAVIIPAESEILKSPTAISSFWKDQIISGAGTYRFDVVDVDVHGNRAYVSTLWSASVYTHDNRVVTFQGNISHVLDRQADGSWKISMQSWG